MTIQSRKVNERGFSLIETTIVIVVAGILATFGIRTLVNYGDVKKLAIASEDVFTVLNQARSRSLSKVKPKVGNCTTSALDGYTVTFACRVEDIGSCPSQRPTYSLSVVCGGQNTLVSQTTTLPEGVTLSSSSASYFFSVVNGWVTGAAGLGTPITLRDSTGATKTITIYSSGLIRAQ